MPSKTVDDWKARLGTICEVYDEKDIFNCDETGVFYRELPSKSFVQKGASSSGVKINKNRFTAMVACSMTGEKLKPLIIGKSAKPCCFLGVNLKAVGILYRFNKKAWMTSAIFVEWLRIINNKMMTAGGRSSCLLTIARPTNSLHYQTLSASSFLPTRRQNSNRVMLE